MSLHELLDVSYDTAASSEPAHPLRKLDVYVPADLTEPPPLLVFVHGGAWRAGDKSSHRPLARAIASTHHVAVAVPNYRLTEGDPPRGRTDIWMHPGHARDVLDAVRFLVSWHEEERERTPPATMAGKAIPGVGYDPSRLYFAGHSCGAHILATLFLQPPALTDLPPTPPQILASTRAVLLSEGIYSLPLLLETFPSYASFVEPAFGWLEPGEERNSYDIFSANHYDMRDGGEHIVWWIVQSEGDELIDAEQAKIMYQSLQILTDGEGEGLLRKDWDTLKEDHDECLDEPRFLGIVGEFLK